jgi:hypothetical protein
LIVDSQLQSILITELDKLLYEYQNTSWLKRQFAIGSLRKRLINVLQEHQLNWITFLRIIYSTWKPKFVDEHSKKFSQPLGDKFLLTILPANDSGFVYVFQFLALVFDDNRLPRENDSFFSQISHVFNFLYNNRNNSLNADRETLHKNWETPGVPSLLESLVLLISAEKTKIFVKNSAYYPADGECWIIAAKDAERLADEGFLALKSETLYFDISLESIVEKIRMRARNVQRITKDEAYRFENYRVIDGGGPGGGFKPKPGHCQIMLSAVSGGGEVNYIQEFRNIIEETQSAQIFRRYFGIS